MRSNLYFDLYQNHIYPEVIRRRTRTSKHTPEYKAFCLFMWIVCPWGSRDGAYWYNEGTR